MAEFHPLHERNPNLHATVDVEVTVDYLRSAGESIPNQPSDKLIAYLGFLADSVNDGVLTGDSESISRQIEAEIVDPSEVPKAFFVMQQRILRQQGHGDIEMTEKLQRELVEVAQADQRASLKRWADFMQEDGQAYPDWFKYYLWGSITKLAPFDMSKQEFRKRSTGTTASFPELNSDAVAKVYEAYTNDQEAREQRSFSKVYASSILETLGTVEAVEVKGGWVKYLELDNQSETTGKQTVTNLVESLAGHNTGWCTATPGTAESQLREGDFYVFYSHDKEGEATVPRIAIHMNYGRVAEVRGILANQEMESEVTDIVRDKLHELPGGEAYNQKAADMQRVTDIENIVRDDPDVTLAFDDLVLLYNFERPIRGFGYKPDPRMSEIISQRDIAKDIQIITGLEVDMSNVNVALQTIMNEGYGQILPVLAGALKGINGETLWQMINDPKAREYFVPERKAEQLREAEEAKRRHELNEIWLEIEDEIGEYITDHLDNFTDAGYDVAKFTISHIDTAVHSRKYIDDLVDRVTATMLNNDGKRYLIDRIPTWQLADTLGNYEDGSFETVTARRLLEAGEEDAVRKNFKKFDAETRRKIKRHFSDFDYII